MTREYKGKQQLQGTLSHCLRTGFLFDATLTSRVQQCKEACAAMRAQGSKEVKFLRDATLEMLEKAKAKLPESTAKRALHGISEDQRTLQATEVIKELLDLGDSLSGRLLIYDSLAASFRNVRFKRDPDCALCGDGPADIADRP